MTQANGIKIKKFIKILDTRYSILITQYSILNTQHKKQYDKSKNTRRAKEI
jgi:hypothetical protein